MNISYRTKGVATIMKMPMKDWKNILHVDVATIVKVLPSCHGQWSDEPPINCLTCCSLFIGFLRGLFHIAPWWNWIVQYCNYDVQGNAGHYPTSKVLVTALANYDLFMYFGHGSGMPRTLIVSFPHPFKLLFPWTHCSRVWWFILISLRLLNPPYFEPDAWQLSSLLFCGNPS